MLRMFLMRCQPAIQHCLPCSLSSSLVENVTICACFDGFTQNLVSRFVLTSSVQFLADSIILGLLCRIKTKSCRFMMLGLPKYILVAASPKSMTMAREYPAK